MESRGEEEEGQGQEAEGEAEGKRKEEPPPRGRRRRGPWHDGVARSKTSKPWEERRETACRTARAGDAPGVRPAPDARRGLKRPRPRRAQGHDPTVRGEARPQARDLEARVPQGRGGRRRPRPEGQEEEEVRGARPLQGAGRGQREQRQQGGEDARHEPDGPPLQAARGRGEALALRRGLPHEEGDARAGDPLPLDMVQARQRGRRRRPARRDALPPEAKAERPEAAPGEDGAGAPDARRQARRSDEPEPLRALRDGHGRVRDERAWRAAGARRPQEQAVRRRAPGARRAGRRRRGAEADDRPQGARKGAVDHDRQRLRVSGPGEDQGRRRLRRLLHAGLRLLGEGLRPGTATGSSADGTRRGRTSRSARARTCAGSSMSSTRSTADCSAERPRTNTTRPMPGPHEGDDQ